jgi:hypothetical protein
MAYFIIFLIVILVENALQREPVFKIFVKLLLIHGLKETILLIANDNLLYCMILFSIFLVHREIYYIYNLEVKSGISQKVYLFL